MQTYVHIYTLTHINMFVSGNKYGHYGQKQLLPIKRLLKIEDLAECLKGIKAWCFTVYTVYNKILNNNHKHRYTYVMSTRRITDLCQ